MVRIPRSCRLRCWASGTFPLEIGISVCSGYHIASSQQSIRIMQECRSSGGIVFVLPRTPLLRTTRYDTSMGTLLHRRKYIVMPSPNVNYSPKLLSAPISFISRSGSGGTAQRRTGGFTLSLIRPTRCSHSARTLLICRYFRIERPFARPTFMATAKVVRGCHIEAACRSERAEELNQVVLLLAG